MKKILLSLSLVLAMGSTQAQNLLSENFDNFTTLAANGWQQTNQSSPVGLSTWAQGGGTAFATGAFNGAATSFALCNFNSTTGAGTISNWLITPSVTLQNGDVISFYSRQGGAEPSFADRMEVRISSNGDFTTNPTGGSADVGDFTTVAVEINPTLTQAGYPLTWTRFSYTVTGLNEPTSSKIGFRYFVTNGGPTGDNSNIIGLDAFSVDRTLATQDFFASNFAVYPNPASNVLNIDSKSNVALTQLQLTDINGRIVKEVKASGLSTQINVSELNAGVYFLKATSAQGTGTTKIVKN